MRLIFLWYFVIFYIWYFSDLSDYRVLMAIIILLTRNRLIYRIQGKTNSNYTFTRLLQLYVYIYVSISFFILLHNYRLYDSRHCKIQNKTCQRSSQKHSKVQKIQWIRKAYGAFSRSGPSLVRHGTIKSSPSIDCLIYYLTIMLYTIGN